MAEFQKKSSGVQELIDRIRNDGVSAAHQEAEKILKDAEKEASRLIAEAKEKSEQMIEKAKAEIESERLASIEALKLSARDTILDLRSLLIARFNEHVNRLVTSATSDEEIVKAIVLVLAGESADKFIKNKELKILISDAIMSKKIDPELIKRGDNTILAIMSDMLREGVELVPSSDITGGARVQLINDKLEIDLSDKAVSEMLFERMLPRFRAILNGKEV